MSEAKRVALLVFQARDVWRATGGNQQQLDQPDRLLAHRGLGSHTEGGVAQVVGDISWVAGCTGDQDVQRTAPGVQWVRLQGDVLEVHGGGSHAVRRDSAQAIWSSSTTSPSLRPSLTAIL